MHSDGDIGRLNKKIKLIKSLNNTLTTDYF